MLKAACDFVYFICFLGSFGIISFSSPRKLNEVQSSSPEVRQKAKNNVGGYGEDVN